MLLDEIRDRLVAQGVGVYGSTIFNASTALIPGGDGPFISLTESGGSGSLRTHNGTAVARPSVQVLTRGKNYSVTRTKAKQAFEALGGDKGLHNVTLTGVFYQNITPRQQPTDIGLDANARVMISFNIDVDKQPS